MPEGESKLVPVSTPKPLRQQFYGEVYYHTTRDNAMVQPTDSRHRPEPNPDPNPGPKQFPLTLTLTLSRTRILTV